MLFIIYGNTQCNVTGTKNWEGGSPWNQTSLKTSWAEHTIMFKLEEKLEERLSWKGNSKTQLRIFTDRGFYTLI